jgi:hypothetical protein
MTTSRLWEPYIERYDAHGLGHRLVGERQRLPQSGRLLLILFNGGVTELVLENNDLEAALLRHEQKANLNHGERC